MKREELDISKFLYDPFDPELVEKLSQYGEFSTHWGEAQKYKKQLCTYIVACYDFGSPLRHRCSDLYERKRLATGMSEGVYDAKGNFKKPIEDALIGKNEAVNLAMTKYIMLFGKPELQLLEANLAQFAFETTLMLKQEGDKDTVKTARELANDINRLTNILYGGDEPLEVRKMLYQDMEQRRVQIRPEDFVKRLEAGDKLKDGSPHGKDYEVEPLKFKSDV